jgi:hypothetical protein
MSPQTSLDAILLTPAPELEQVKVVEAEAPKKDPVREMFKNFPKKVRALKIMEWYAERPGEWERRHGKKEGKR